MRETVPRKRDPRFLVPECWGIPGLFKEENLKFLTFGVGS